LLRSLGVSFLRSRRGNHLRRSPRGFYFIRRGLGKQVRGHRDLALQLPAAQNLQPILQLMDYAEFEQILRSEAIAFQSLQRPDVHHRELLAEDVGESTFWQTAMQRHLAAFKSAHSRITGNRLGALGSAAGILAASGTHALADALFLVLLSRGRFQIAEV